MYTALMDSKVAMKLATFDFTMKFGNFRVRDQWIHHSSCNNSERQQQVLGAECSINSCCWRCKKDPAREKGFQI